MSEPVIESFSWSIELMGEPNYIGFDDGSVRLVSFIGDDGKDWLPWATMREVKALTKQCETHWRTRFERAREENAGR